jgi:S-methylmethionine-dependent homocysteine/selenocysteine methylase
LNELHEKYDGNFPKAWMSFSCKDSEHINDGSELAHVLETISSLDVRNTIVGFGVNCTPFKYILSTSNTSSPSSSSVVEETETETKFRGLLTVLANHGQGRHVVIYPNSGEIFDGVTKDWDPDDDLLDEEEVELSAGAVVAPTIDQSSSVTSSSSSSSFVASSSEISIASASLAAQIDEAATVTERRKERAFINRFLRDASRWKEYMMNKQHGADLNLCVGGCCRIGPDDIQNLRKRFETS